MVEGPGPGSENQRTPPQPHARALELRDALGPVVLGVAPFRLLLKELDDPFRTMVILDLATGLRCSELFALQWRDAA